MLKTLQVQARGIKSNIGTLEIFRFDSRSVFSAVQQQLNLIGIEIAEFKRHARKHSRMGRHNRTQFSDHRLAVRNRQMRNTGRHVYEHRRQFEPGGKIGDIAQRIHKRELNRGTLGRKAGEKFRDIAVRDQFGLGVNHIE